MKCTALRLAAPAPQLFHVKPPGARAYITVRRIVDCVRTGKVQILKMWHSRRHRDEEDRVRNELEGAVVNLEHMRRHGTPEEIAFAREKVGTLVVEFTRLLRHGPAREESDNQVREQA